jgi:hypothetical protein
MSAANSVMWAQSTWRFAKAALRLLEKSHAFRAVLCAPLSTFGQQRSRCVRVCARQKSAAATAAASGARTQQKKNELLQARRANASGER